MADTFLMPSSAKANNSAQWDQRRRKGDVAMCHAGLFASPGQLCLLYGNQCSWNHLAGTGSHFMLYIITQAIYIYIYTRNICVLEKRQEKSRKYVAQLLSTQPRF